MAKDNTFAIQPKTKIRKIPIEDDECHDLK